MSGARAGPAAVRVRRRATTPTARRATASSDRQQAERQQGDRQQARPPAARPPAARQQRDQQGSRQQGATQQGGNPQQGTQPRRDGDEDGLDERGGRRRRSRDRYRDRDRDRKGRGTRGRPGAGELAGLDDIEVSDDDVLLPVAGILDLMDSYAFVRTTGYLPSANDVYVSLNQVKRYGLRRGDAVTGAVRQPREGEQPPRRATGPASSTRWSASTRSTAWSPTAPACAPSSTS